MKKNAIRVVLTALFLFCGTEYTVSNPSFYNSEVEALRSASLSADAIIEGKIVEAGTNDPLIGASVFIKGTTRGMATDLEGNYSIRGLSAGDYVVVISYLGFKQKEIPVSLSDGERLTLNEELEWQGVQGEEVTITAQARGQISAINEQLASNTISNIVAKD
ncbi:MAG: carboxypeptidase-like regulatory domain-containing protein, partial [Balneolales bacterium]|nr:carboxypeptidase-like regulatory domain-containing protein [Balneolales bacterium]